MFPDHKQNRNRIFIHPSPFVHPEKGFIHPGVNERFTRLRS